MRFICLFPKLREKSLIALWLLFLLLQEPPNLNEMMKPMQNVSSPASQGLKDDDDDDGEGEDAEGEGEKVDPLNVNSERLKAFNVSNGFFLLHLGSITSVFFKFLSRQSLVKSRQL